MLTESNKLDNTCTDTIGLDKPCKFCKVLELDDALYDGETKTKEDGTPFVDFGEIVETKQDRIATSGLTRAKLGKALSYAMRNHDADAPKTIAKTELGLSYSRSDQLPDLQALNGTASTGCVFCQVLRCDLKNAWETIKENWGDEEEDDKDREDEEQEEKEEDIPEQEEGDDADAEDSEDEDDEGGERNDADRHGESSDKREGQKEEVLTHGNADEKDKDTKEDQQELLVWNSENSDRSSDYTSAVENDHFVDTDEDTDAEENKEEDIEGVGEAKGEKKEDEAKIEAAEQFRSPVVASEVPPAKAELAITEITYKLREYGADDDRPQRTWLDALYIFFTIEYQGKKRRYSIHYNIYAEESNSCTSWLEINRRPIINDVLSPASVGRMNELIRLSEKEQPVKVVEKPFLPTRLLDVQASCPSGLRLVITKTDPDVWKLDASQRRYAALSYCWGSRDAALKQLMTTKDVLQKHLDEIPMEKVPLTVADSIRVCRALEIRYLWVDALCIIQGDRDDWSNESFQMSSIYENSYLTLCIVQGDSCSSGFLHKDYNPPNVRVKFQSKLNNSVSGNITLRMLHPPSATVRRCTKQEGKYGRPDDSAGNSDINEVSWSKRGWTFQEDQLAPRKVFFGNLMFHVNRGSQLEAADGSTVWRFRFVETMDALERGLETWYRMIENYSKRNLSYENDKFPAIAALTRSFSEKFKNQTYLAGLWESDIHKGLLWTCSAWLEFDEYQKLVSKDYIAPSWSWARRSLPVNWILDHNKRPKSELVVRGSEITVTDMNNAFGCIAEGRLLLTARIFKPPTRRNGKIRIKHSYNLWKYMNSPSFNYISWSKSNKYMAKIRFDWDSQSCLNDEGYPRGPMNDICLILTASIFPGDDVLLRSHDLADDQELLLGIVVWPSPKEEGAYERIGVFFTEDRGKGGRKFWQDIPMQDLVLV
ncbi:hypothetical protein FPOAC2_05783 [Fusarium poae]